MCIRDSHNRKQQEARACVLCECGKFATQALFSVQVMALGSTNREVNMTAWEVLFLETMLQLIWPPRNTNNTTFVFEPAFLPTTKKHKPIFQSLSIYEPQAQQNSLQSAQYRAPKYMQ